MCANTIRLHKIMAKALSRLHPKLVFRDREEGVVKTKGKTGNVEETEVSRRETCTSCFAMSCTLLTDLFSLAVGVRMDSSGQVPGV